MLIIFDLDDTLIDTSGCITPIKMEDALRAMVDAGLQLPDVADALGLLKRLDKSATRGAEALAEFIEILGADRSFFEVGKQEWYGNLPDDLVLFPLDGAIELLAELAQDHELAIVTAGQSTIQREKLKKAGIDSRLFSKIVVSEDSRKKQAYYKELMDELGYSPSETLVCGDRISIDLTPARDLGCKTVQVQWGRGLNSQGRQADVDYKIAALGELREIIAQLMTFSAF